jgi:hypothetical protein
LGFGSGLSTDDVKLSNVLKTDFLSVMTLFIDYVTPTDNAVTFEGKTSAPRQ